MQAITNNPYRTLGLLTGASTKEITRQTNRLKKYITADAELPDDYSFAKIDNFQRTVEMIDDAVERNDTDPEKIENALFWFWKGNEITDEPAFDALKEGDVENAFSIWLKLVNHKDENGKLFWTELTQKNFSAYHNIAVLTLTGRIDKWSFVSAVMANIYFIESDYFAEFVKSVADETYKANKKNIELLFLEKITNSIAEKETKTTFSELVKYLNDYDFVAKADFVKSISKSFADNIKTAITTCENARKKSKEKAATAGETLYKNTKNDLVQLKAIFGEQDFRHSNVADKVANEFLQCSIDYFNYMQEQDSDIDYHARATKLVKLAQSIAVGNSVKGRAKDNLDTLEQMKNKEINNAISTLQMIKDAYEQACRRIDAQVEQQSLTLGWNQSINWSAVEENKRNALDWNKVNGLLRDVLSDKKIEKIKSCTNATQKQEFETLAEWVKKHSTSKSVINNALNNYYGKTTSTISNTQRPTTSFTPRTSSTTNNQHSKEKTWFPKNAWWVMGGIGGIIGAFVASFTIGAIIGTVLGWIIKKAND